MSFFSVFRLYVIKKLPFLVHEMVNCISQLILLAHAGRIGRLPSLDTIEFAMKLSPMIVQALWDKASPLLQLPHIEEDMLKHFHSRRRNCKTLQQLAKMKVRLRKRKTIGSEFLFHISFSLYFRKRTAGPCSVALRTRHTEM